MDTSNPAVFVNAELLGRYVGRKVRAVIQVIRNDGSAVVGKSTDEKQIIVKGLPPPNSQLLLRLLGLLMVKIPSLLISGPILAIISTLLLTTNFVNLQMANTNTYFFEVL